MTNTMTHDELVNKAIEILRSSMQYNGICDDELRENAENAGDTILMAFIEKYEE